MKVCGDYSWAVGRPWQNIFACSSVMLISLAVSQAAADTWYEELAPKTKAAFEHHAPDYISINSYLWSAATLHAVEQYEQRTGRSLPNIQVQHRVRPNYYDPKKRQVVSSFNAMITSTPGVEMIMGKVESITQDGALVARHYRNKVLLLDHSPERAVGDRVQIAAIKMGSQTRQSDTGEEDTILRYKVVSIDYKVSANELARYFYDNEINTFVRFDVRKIVDPRAKKRRYVKTPGATCGTWDYRLDPRPRPKYEWRGQRRRIPSFPPDTKLVQRAETGYHSFP